MASPDSSLPPLRFGLGVNNRAEETKLPAGSARAIINLDITAGGGLAARRGRTLLYPSAGVHSLWSCESIDFGLYVQDDTLYLLGEAGERIALRDGLQQRDMSYTFVNSRVYYSNGVDTGCVTGMGTTQTWGVEAPPDTYVAIAAATGGLAAGEYLVALTYSAGKEESGAAPAQAVNVPDGGGITLTNLPAPSDNGVTALRVYLSPANDPRLFHARDVAVGMSAVTLGTGGLGRLLDTQFLRPAPPGRHLLVNNGRIFSASGRLTRWTEALRYGLYDPANNYLTVPKPVTALAAPDVAGFVLYIGTSTKTYLFQGEDISSASMVAAAHVGVVEGSVVQVHHEALDIQGVNYPCPVWMGTNGAFYVGTQQGIMPLNKGAVGQVYGKVAAAFIERDGAQRLVMAGVGGKKPALAFSDQAVARVIEIGSAT